MVIAHDAFCLPTLASAMQCHWRHTMCLSLSQKATRVRMYEQQALLLVAIMITVVLAAPIM
jgi:hypothetical protein